MNKKLLLVALLLVATVISASAQRPRPPRPPGFVNSPKAQKLTGDISVLKDQKEVNLVLDFSDILVNGKTEEKFIADETKRKNEAGEEKWLEEWNEKLRSDAYALLKKELNYKVSEKYFMAGEFAEAEYTIIVKVKEITTGSFMPISRPSAVRAEVSFIETGETTPFETVEFKKSSHRFSSDTPNFIGRVAMSFGSLGVDIGETINKALKK